MGKDIADQQVGCLWQGDHLITLSLSGAINYLDKNNPDTPKKVVTVGILYSTDFGNERSDPLDWIQEFFRSCSLLLSCQSIMICFYSERAPQSS